MKSYFAEEENGVGKVFVIWEKQWTDDLKNKIINESISHIRFPDAVFNSYEKFDFFSDLSDVYLTGLEIYTRYLKDVSNIDIFPHLKVLSLPPLCNKAPNISSFGKLEILKMDHRKCLESAYECKGLKQFWVNKYPYPDLTSIAAPETIEHLMIHDGRLESLEGIERFKSLRTIDFYRIRNLTSLEPLKNCPSLLQLQIGACGKAKFNRDEFNFDIKG